MEITETFYPKDPGVWRAWFERNHKKTREAWRMFYKKLTNGKKVIFLLLFCFLVAGFMYRNWPSERGSKVRLRIRNNDHYGRIIALPGESIRLGLKTGRIYIKKGDQAFRFKETYLKRDTFTSALAFTTSWTNLAPDKYFILPDEREISTMSDFVYIDNVVSKDQIFEKLQRGKKGDYVFEPINPEKEFAMETDAQTLAWKKMAPATINIKNFAKPVVSGNYLFVPTTKDISVPSSPHSLLAYNSRTGEKLWESIFTSYIVELLPELDDEFIYVFTYDKTVYALRKTTGQRIWQAQSNPYISQPKVSNLEVMLVQDENELKALDRKTGAVRWKHGKNFISTDQKHAVIITGESQENQPELALIDSNSGTIMWSARVGGIVKETSKAFMVLGQDLSAVDKVTGKILWRSPLTINAKRNETDFQMTEGSLLLLESVGDAAIVSKRSETTGQLIWQRVLSKAGLHADFVEPVDHYIVLRTGDGGNSYEDYPIKERVYIIDNSTGRLVFTQGLPSYARLNRIGNTLLISQKDMQAIDIPTGRKIWEYKNLEPHDGKELNVVIDKEKKLLFVRNLDLIEHLSLTDGKVLWSQRIDDKYGDVYLESNALYYFRYEGGSLNAFDTETGQLQWSVDGIFPNIERYIDASGLLYFRRVEKYGWRGATNSLFRFDPKTHKEQKLFSHVVFADSDILIDYANPYIYVYTDDFIYAFNYN